MIGDFGTFEFSLSSRYRFEQELGRGGMGVVYRAHDIKLDRPVAIKMLHPALTDEVGIARFESEILIGASLHHPNIIAVHEAGEADGRLYYSMDYLGGETLRALLQREKQLSTEDAIRILNDVAAGLQHAHDRQFIHRDVKPENILIADGRACILDFGLAKSIANIDATRLTASGLAVGTPHYLSPEQAGAERDITPKSDQYALACVLYEMLIGEPPFTGPTASAIAMRHLAEPAPSIRLRRRTTPESIETAVRRAMEKVPADRFRSVRLFSEAAMSEPPAATERDAPTASTVHPSRRRLGSIALGFVLAAALLVLVDRMRRGAFLGPVFASALDSTRYAIIPFRRDSASAVSIHESEIIYDAITRWEGVRAVDLFQVRDELRRDGGIPGNATAASRAARRVGAGRYIWGQVTSSGSQTRVRAQLFDTSRPEAVLAEATARFDGTTGSDDVVWARIVDSLLFGKPRGITDDSDIGTRSRPARQAFLRGLEATSSWDLASADSSFRNATEYDTQYERAHFWLAQTRAWSRNNPPNLRALASRAVQRADRLPPRERELARALAAMSDGKFAEACAIYEAINGADATFFAAWYGIGECNAKDDIVIRDRGRLRFRSSYRRGLEAYEHAFALLPSINRSFSASAFSRLQRLLKTSSNDLRSGRAAPPDTARFAAYPEWEGDTLGFTPQPLRQIEEALPSTIPRSLATAVDAERQLFRRITATWAAALPNDPSALEAVAVSLDLLGDRSAVDTLRRARRLSADSSQILRLAAQEVWARLKFAIPDSAKELAAARVLADSLIRKATHRNQADASVLLSLSAVTGDIDAAIALVGSAKPFDLAGMQLPQNVLRDARAIEVYAAFGGPSDSLRRIAARLENEIQNVNSAIRADARRRLLSRAAML
ncbi:MAG TPA: serine/threonine-protein kinase, partial [Gemmatimonadaceae bacterium]|nr:serine/threonine-protein kinase [Gemmatimonadaceae bacterium]